MLKGYLKKHSTCHFQVGANRGLIYDNNRKAYFLVPVSLIEFVNESEHKLIEEVQLYYKDSELTVINQYLDFLVSKEIIFFCDSIEELNCFPDLSKEWSYPARISNAVVEVGSLQNILSFKKFKQDFFIPYIQFDLQFRLVSLITLSHILDLMDSDNSKGIQIFFNNQNDFLEEDIVQLCKEQGKIETVVVYNSQYEKVIQSSTCNIYFVTQKGITHKNCGIINQRYFNLQLSHYTESLAHNTCLNRKLAIDVDGNIKNCPSMQESFGNIKDTTLEEAINKPGFKKYWNITKDQITKCKDCEFRHICTDCRAYIENPDDMYSAPLKCGYNPYTCEWEEWSLNPLKQNAIEYYDLKHLVKE